MPYAPTLTSFEITSTAVVRAYDRKKEVKDLNG